MNTDFGVIGDLISGRSAVHVPQVHDVGDINSINEIHRVSCDNRADIRKLCLLIEQLHKAALVSVIQMSIGLIVEKHGVLARSAKKIGIELPNGQGDSARPPRSRLTEVHLLAAFVDRAHFERLEPAIESHYRVNVDFADVPAFLLDVLTERFGVRNHPILKLFCQILQIALDGFVLGVSRVGRLEGGENSLLGILC